jgi:hypothetical protein
LEKLGVHAGVVITEAFRGIADATFTSAGNADHLTVVLPPETEFAKTDELRQYADQIVREIFRA